MARYQETPSQEIPKRHKLRGHYATPDKPLRTGQTVWLVHAAKLVRTIITIFESIIFRHEIVFRTPHSRMVDCIRSRRVSFVRHRLPWRRCYPWVTRAKSVLRFRPNFVVHTTTSYIYIYLVSFDSSLPLWCVPITGVSQYVVVVVLVVVVLVVVLAWYGTDDPMMRVIYIYIWLWTNLNNNNNNYNYHYNYIYIY